MQTFKPIDYLYIDIANTFGLDKETWSTRIQWVNSNFDNLEDFSEDAKDRPLFNKAVAALRRVHLGEAIGHIMYLDATASGMGILAILSGCESTAAAVNLIYTGEREDVYEFMAKAINKVTPSLKITREIIKKPLMTVWYNSNAKPKEILGEDTPAYEAFMATLLDKFGGAYEAQMSINKYWNSNTLAHTWTLPDGHIAHCPVLEVATKKINCFLLDSSFTHAVTINTPSTRWLSLAANIVHSIDGYVCRQMIYRCKLLNIDLVTVHDAFGFSPIYGNEVRQIYVEILSELANMDLLSDILSEISGKKLYFPKKSNKLSQAILASEYALS